MKSFPIEALSHAPLTAMMKCVKENHIKPADIAMNLWDTYQLIKKLSDPCISDNEKLAELAMLAAQWAGGKVLGKLLDAIQQMKWVSKLGCFAAGTLVLTATAATAAPIRIPIEEACMGGWLPGLC